MRGMELSSLERFTDKENSFMGEQILLVFDNLFCSICLNGVFIGFSKIESMEIKVAWHMVTKSFISDIKTNFN